MLMLVRTLPFFRLAASLTAGGWAQAFGYRSMFLACAVQSVLGLAMIQFQPGELRQL